MQVASSITKPLPAIYHSANDQSDEESISAPPYSPFSLSSSDELQSNSSNSNVDVDDHEQSMEIEVISDDREPVRSLPHKPNNYYMHLYFLYMYIISGKSNQPVKD